MSGYENARYVVNIFEIVLVFLGVGCLLFMAGQLLNSVFSYINQHYVHLEDFKCEAYEKEIKISDSMISNGIQVMYNSHSSDEYKIREIYIAMEIAKLKG